MTAPNPTTCNTTLWAAFIEDAYGPWIEPFWGKDGVTAFAEGVSLFMTALMGGGIARLYVDNAADVSSFIATSRLEYGEPMPQIAAAEAPLLLAAPDLADTVPPWLAVESPAAIEVPFDVAPEYEAAGAR